MTPPAERHLDEEILQLMERMRARIGSLLHSFRIPPAEAEDLVQEGLLALVRSWDRVLDKERWLYSTLRYLCCGYLRRERYGSRASGVDPEVLAALAPSDPGAQQRLDLQLDLEQLAETLSQRQRQLLRLRYVAGMSHAEAGRCLGYRPTSVHRSVKRSIRLLRQQVGPGPAPPARRSAPAQPRLPRPGEAEPV